MRKKSNIVIVMLFIATLVLGGCNSNNEKAEQKENIGDTKAVEKGEHIKIDDTIEILATTYVYGESKNLVTDEKEVKGKEIGNTGIYYTVVNGEEKKGEIYGVTSMSYADYYYAELTEVEDKNTYAMENPSTKIATNELYDVITSATSLPGAHAESYPEIIKYKKGTDLETDPMTISGIDTVDIAVEAILYVEGMILDKVKPNEYPLGNAVTKITLNEDIHQPIYGNNVKKLLADGSYMKAKRIDSMLKVIRTSDIKVSSKVRYSSPFGDYQFNSVLEGFDRENQESELYYPNFLKNVYAVTITNENGDIAGAIHYEDIWSEEHHSGVEVGITNGVFNAPHDYTFTTKRFEKFFEKDTKTLIPGIYTMVIKARGYEDIAVDFNVGISLKEEEKIMTEDVIWKEKGVTVKVDTTKLPQEFSLDKVEIRKKETREKIEEGIDFSYDKEKNELKIMNTKVTGIGEYILTIIDNRYEPVSATIKLMSTLTEKEVSMVDGQVIVKSDIITIEEYVAYLVEIEILPEGEGENEFAYVKEDDIIDEKGNINPDSGYDDIKFFEPGKTYILNFIAYGFETFSLSYTAPK